MGKILEIRESSAKTIEINGAISPSTASGGRIPATFQYSTPGPYNSLNKNTWTKEKKENHDVKRTASFTCYLN
jgi:hypothetical protein